MGRRMRHSNLRDTGAANVYDARFEPLANDVKVETWRNRVSPGVNDATMPNASFRPTLKSRAINGSAALYFDGNNFFSMNVTPVSDIEIYFVGSHANKPWTGNYNSDLQVYIDQYHSVSIGFVFQTRPDLSSTLLNGVAIPSNNPVSYNIVGGTTNIISFSRVKAGNSVGYLNGGNRSFVSNSQQWIQSSPQQIGRWSAGYRYLNGYIATMVIFEKLNTDSNRKRIEHLMAFSFKLKCD